jgi:hypothetical protein
MPNLSSPFSLFLNPSQIQIRTQFTWVPVLLPLLGPRSSFLPIFSLSPPVLLCFFLPCSRAFHGHFTVEDKQKNTQQNKNKQKMQETILSVLSDKKKSEEGKEEEELELVVPPPCRTQSPAGSRRVTPTKMMDPRMARP